MTTLESQAGNGNAEWAQRRQQAIRELIAAGKSREEAVRQVNELMGTVAPGTA